MTTLLAMIQNVADKLTFPRPGSVVGSTDQTARTLLAHARDEGRDLVGAFDWTILQRLATITTVSGTDEYALESDFHRLVGSTEWDTTNRRPVIGPTSAIEWRYVKSSLVGSSIAGYRYRIMRGTTGIARKVFLDPEPTVNGDELTFEYISNGYCASSAEVVQSTWTADTDVPILDSRLMELGIEIRYRRAKGLAFSSEADEYTDLFYKLTGQDRPSKILSMSPRPNTQLLGFNNLPETGYGS